MPPLDQTRLAIAVAIGGAAVLLALLVLSPTPAPIAPSVQVPAAPPIPPLVPTD